LARPGTELNRSNPIILITKEHPLQTTYTIPSNTVDLTGRVAVVTGAGSGIGRSIALTFARQGAEVLVADISTKGAEETVGLIEAEGLKAWAVTSNVADENSVKAMIDELVAQRGKIDILVNNAGIMDNMAFLEDVSTDLWNRIMAINVSGPFFLLRAVLPHMRAAGKGAIINIASEAGIRGGAAGGAYVASKHAVVGLTRSVAWSHGREGVRCNAICPGPIETGITGGKGLEIFDQKGLERVLPVMSLCEGAAQPDAIANAALFLASDAAFFVNGVIMPVDGGWSAG
jgi:NAD(P)-dependent dehydrogenase (short-subunit alcohol dehydrogenase family)